MIIFKILKAAAQLLPWVLLAVLIYALWPLIQVFLTISQKVHNLFGMVVF